MWEFVGAELEQDVAYANGLRQVTEQHKAFTAPLPPAVARSKALAKHAVGKPAVIAAFPGTEPASGDSRGLEPAGAAQQCWDAPPAMCACGRVFLTDANFCSGCGVPFQYPRMTNQCFRSVGEMLAMVEGMHKGAADTVFEKVLVALDAAASTATDSINANVKTLVSLSEDRGCLSGLDAAGTLRSVPLSGARFVGHAGHHSTQQVIGHLLHLAVQLTLFPHRPMTTRGGQVGAPFSALVEGASQTKPVPQRCSAAVQTDGKELAPPRRLGPSMGVRIGGGFHLLQTEDQSSEGEAQAQRPGVASGQGRRRKPPPAHLEEVAQETLRGRSSRSPSPARAPSPPFKSSSVPFKLPASAVSLPLESPVDASPPWEDAAARHHFAFGARSEGVPPDRFEVRAYAPGAQDVERVCPEKDIRHRHHGEGVQLSRYLAHRTRPASAGLARPVTPRSVLARPGGRPSTAGKERSFWANRGTSTRGRPGSAEKCNVGNGHVFVGVGQTYLPSCAAARRLSPPEKELGRKLTEDLPDGDVRGQIACAS